MIGALAEFFGVCRGSWDVPVRGDGEEICGGSEAAAVVAADAGSGETAGDAIVVLLLDGETIDAGG